LKISYAQNEFENTVLGKLNASFKGLVLVTLAADDDSYNITIKSGLPDDLTVKKKTLLTVEISKEIAKTVEAKLNEINPKFVKEWVLHNDSGTLKMYVSEEFQEMFFAVLASLPNGLTESQTIEIKSRLEFNPSQVQRYSFWTRSANDKAKDERQELMQTYNQYASAFDAGTQALLKDILTQPVNQKTNVLFKKTLKGTYSDFHSHLATPKSVLISHLTQAKISDELIKKAKSGEYKNDPTPWPYTPVSVAVNAASQAFKM
jgi:hypothetical protein